MRLWCTPLDEFIKTAWYTIQKFIRQIKHQYKFVVVGMASKGDSLLSPSRNYSLFHGNLQPDNVSTPLSGVSSTTFNDGTSATHGLLLEPPAVSRIHGYSDMAGFSDLPPVYTDSGFHSLPSILINSATSDEGDNKDDSRCANCNSTFVPRKRPVVGVRRYSLKSLQMDHLPMASKGNFICSDCNRCVTQLQTSTFMCGLPVPEASTVPSPSTPPPELQSQPDVSVDEASLLFNEHNYYTSGRKSNPLKGSPTRTVRGQAKRTFSSPLMRTPKRRKPQVKPGPVHKRVDFKEKVISLIRQSKYEAALRTMYRAPNREVKKAFQRLFAAEIASELKDFLKIPKAKTAFCNDFKQEKVSEFNWTKEIQSVRQYIPLTVTAATAILPNAKQVARQVVTGRKGRKQ